MPKIVENKKNTQKIIKMLEGIKQLLEIKGESIFKIKAYERANSSLKNLNQDVNLIYRKDGIKGIKKIPKIGEGIAKKIEEYLKKGKLKYYEDLKRETAVRQIVTYFFETKGIDSVEKVPPANTGLGVAPLALGIISIISPSR